MDNGPRTMDHRPWTTTAANGQRTTTTDHDKTMYMLGSKINMIGSKINIGQAVCILEAMKLMNELESEVSGEVIEILVENGTPVEFGQVLMRLKPG